MKALYAKAVEALKTHLTREEFLAFGDELDADVHNDFLVAVTNEAYKMDPDSFEDKDERQRMMYPGESVVTWKQNGEGRCVISKMEGLGPGMYRIWFTTDGNAGNEREFIISRVQLEAIAEASQIMKEKG